MLVSVRMPWVCQSGSGDSHCLIHLYLCSSPTVPNLLPNEDELTIRVCSSDHSWSFVVILAMTINSNSVLLVSVTSAGWYESFEHAQKVCIPSSAQHEYFSFVVMHIENV